MVFLNVSQRYNFKLMSRFAVVVAMVSQLQSAGAGEIGGSNLCADEYALCSASICQAISGDPDHVVCQCEGPFKGLNLGHTSCKARTLALTSTFSVENQFEKPTQKPLHLTHCTGPNAGRWADCLDSPCTTENGSVTCKCPVKKSDFFILSAQCPGSASDLTSACSTMRSGVVVERPTQDLMSSFYGDPPKVPNCPAVR